MSWDGTFKTDDSEIREKIKSKRKELLELMENNFKATNSFIRIVNENLRLSFKPITLNKEATLQKNCKVMIERVQEIQENVVKIDKELQKQNFKEVADFVKASAFEEVSNALVTFMITYKQILINITTMCAKFAGVSWASTLVEVIASFFNSVECDELEKTLADLEKTLAEFRPASEKYQNAINEVQNKLKRSHCTIL